MKRLKAYTAEDQRCVGGSFSSDPGARKASERVKFSRKTRKVADSGCRTSTILLVNVFHQMTATHMETPQRRHRKPSRIPVLGCRRTFVAEFILPAATTECGRCAEEKKVPVSPPPAQSSSDLAWPPGRGPRRRRRSTAAPTA